MKYHIYNADGIALYWNEDVLEFDTYESASRFLVSAMANSEHLEDFWSNVIIKEDILFVNGDVAHLNATNLIIGWDDDNDECVLMEVNK